MKKLILLVAVVFAMAIASCGSKKAEPAVEETTVEITEVTEAPAAGNDSIQGDSATVKSDSAAVKVDSSAVQK